MIVDSRKLLTVFIVILVAICAWVLADFYSLFGVKTFASNEYIEARFRTIDKQTGQLIAGVKVRCVQRGNSNACAQRDSGTRGVVSILLPGKKIISRTFLFIKSEQYKSPPQPVVQIIFVHPSYVSEFKAFKLMELFDKFGKPEVVSLELDKY